MNHNVILNISNEESSIELLKQLRDKDYVPFDVEITNSHITEYIGLISQVYQLN